MNRRIVIEGFNERLELAIAESGMNRSEIARMMGMNRKVLIPSTTGCQMSLGPLAKFCAITGVSADWMLGLRREMEL